MPDSRFIPAEDGSGRYLDLADKISYEEMRYRSSNPMRKLPIGYTEERSSSVTVKAENPQEAPRFPRILPNVRQVPGEDDGVRILNAERISAQQREDTISQINQADSEGYFLDAEEAGKRRDYVLEAETAAQLAAITADLRPVTVKSRLKRHQSLMAAGSNDDVSMPKWLKKLGKFLNAFFTDRYTACSIVLAGSVGFVIFMAMTFLGGKNPSPGAIVAAVVGIAVGVVGAIISIAGICDKLFN